jgi:hypothetical protein
MVWNEITKFLVVFLLRTGSERITSIFILMRNSLEQNYEVPSVFLFNKIVLNGIPRFFIFRGMARKGIQSVLRSAKQAKFRQNESKFLSV